MREWKIILPENIIGLWGNISQLVDKACAAGNNKYSTNYFLYTLLENQTQLWMDDSNKSAVITDIIIFPYRKYARLILGLGENAQDLESFINTFESWAKELGCQGVLSEMRLGLTPPFKKAGWKQTHILMEKEF